MKPVLNFLIIALIVTLGLLWIKDESGITLGFSNDEFASLLALTLMGLYAGLTLLRHSPAKGTRLRNSAIWLSIFIALIAGYQNRHALVDFSSTITAGLIPSRPRVTEGADGTTIVTIGKSDNGHFEADAIVNGTSLRFLIDTGATGIALSARDAKAIGIDMASLSYTVSISTANGQAMAAPVRIDEIIIGSIIRRNMRALVAKEGAFDQSLLGMEFLNSLSSFTFQQDQLLLND